jgi:hypothetical protein
MQISGVSLTLTWPLRLCLLRVLLGATTTATSFPLSKHIGGGDTAPAFSGLRVYLQFTWEVGLPPSPVEFSSHRHFYKISHSCLLGMWHHSCLLQPACCEEFPLPPFSTQSTLLSLLRVFSVVIAHYLAFFFLFFPGWGVGLSRGLCWSGPWLSVGVLSDTYLTLWLHLPKPSGRCRLAVAREPSWFLHLMWSGDAMHRLEVCKSQSFASSWCFFL